MLEAETDELNNKDLKSCLVETFLGLPRSQNAKSIFGFVAAGTLYYASQAY